MTARWEYALLVWNYSVAPRKGTEPSDNDWVYKRDFYIWRPGAEEADHRAVMDSEDESVSGPSLTEILNELGAEGWELIDTRDTGSLVGKTLRLVRRLVPDRLDTNV